VQVAVNVSPQQMVTGDVVSSIRGACVRHVVEPLFLQVELTESCLIDDAESAMKLLAEIRRLGCQIALDDFGTATRRCPICADCRWTSSRSIAVSYRVSARSRVTATWHSTSLASAARSG
jgi:hypothetical protein